jgi:hypothetical protein
VNFYSISFRFIYNVTIKFYVFHVYTSSVCEMLRHRFELRCSGINVFDIWFLNCISNFLRHQKRACSLRCPDKTRSAATSRLVASVSCSMYLLLSFQLVTKHSHKCWTHFLETKRNFKFSPVRLLLINYTSYKYFNKIRREVLLLYSAFDSMLHYALS